MPVGFSNFYFSFFFTGLMLLFHAEFLFAEPASTPSNRLCLSAFLARTGSSSDAGLDELKLIQNLSQVQNQPHHLIPIVDTSASGSRYFVLVGPTNQSWNLTGYLVEGSQTQPRILQILHGSHALRAYKRLSKDPDFMEYLTSFAATKLHIEGLISRRDMENLKVEIHFRSAHEIWLRTQSPKLANYYWIRIRTDLLRDFQRTDLIEETN